VLATSNANKAKEKTAEWTVHTSCGRWTWEKNTRERERPGQKLGTKAQSSKQRAKKGPPKKKEKKGKKKRKKKCTYKVYICSLEKIVLVHNKRNALHSMV